MISGPFLELYALSVQAERLERRRQHPVAPPHKPRLWAQWLARALVCLAASLSGAQVRIEWPARA